MKALDVALICSGSPGFLRSLGSLLAGRCRLMECYSIPEATQMIQLHAPDFPIFDVRSCSPQQLARTFAAIANIKSGQAALICVPGPAPRLTGFRRKFFRFVALSNFQITTKIITNWLKRFFRRQQNQQRDRPCNGKESDSSGSCDAATEAPSAACRTN